MSDVLFIECKICHKQCKNYTSLGTHIVRAHPTITLADYYKTYLKTNENEGKCLICGKDTAFKRLSIGFHKYCSCTCMGKDDTVIEKRKQTCLERYGVDSSSKLPQAHCAGLKAYYKKTGLINPAYDENNYRKGRQKYEYNNIVFDSSWELCYYIWLTDNNIPFTYHPEIKFEYMYNNKIHYYFVDFYVNGIYQELKGPQFFDEYGNFINPYDRSLDEQYNEKYKCMLNNNIEIIKNCNQYIRYVHKKYGKNFISQYKKY